MKLSTLLTIGSIILCATACGPSYDDYYEEDYYYGDEEYYGDYSEEELALLESKMDGEYSQRPGRSAEQGNYNARTANYSSGGQVEMRPLIDSKTGRVSAYAPLPANWKIGKAWEGPGGTLVELQNGGTANSQQRPIQSIDQLIQSTFLPQIKSQGGQVNNIIDLPGIARNNQKNYAQYSQTMPMQVSHQVKGIDITDAQGGKKYFIIVHLINCQSQYGGTNTYYANILSASPNNFEQDKRTLIYALENLSFDQQGVANHNQREQQRSNASWSAHNQKMRNNQANFDSWQKTQQTYSEISDISHEGWKRRNGMTDAGHDKSINGIWEREGVNNPYSGQSTNVGAGYKYYYMNSDGQYFGTNDEYYNPMRDPNLNHTQWRKVQRPSNNY